MFLHLNQNNSGGYFIIDDKVGISEDVIIECDTVNEGWEYFNSLNTDDLEDDLFDYCSCCGERWSLFLIDDKDLTKEPMINGETIENIKKGMFRETCFIHYKDKENRRIKKHTFEETK